MHGSNKFLFSMVMGVILLVIVAFSVVLLRPEPTYQDDSTAGGAAHNYLLALQQEDYERAYQYIPTAYKYPTDANDLADNVRQENWRFEDDSEFSLAVESVKPRGENEAIVTVRKTTFYNEGLMGSYEDSHTFTMKMLLEDGAWKVGDSSDYWSDCWGTTTKNWCH